MKTNRHTLTCLLALCFLAITLSTCKKTEEPEMTFHVEASDIGAFSATITITHNGTNRDLYCGKVYEGEEIDEQEKIDELLNLFWAGQLEDELFSQRKRVIHISGLSSEKTYTYIAFGISNDGTQVGAPGKTTFTTAVSDFTAVENPNWNVSYQGEALYNNGYYSKIKVSVTGEIEERYFLTTYPVSTLDHFASEEGLIAFAVEEFNKNNVENDPDYWLDTNNVATSSCIFYQYHDEDDYVSYAIGISATGTPTGHYAKYGSFHINKYPMTEGYAYLMGDWVITDKQGKMFYVTFTEQQVNRIATMTGWGNYDIPIIVQYDQTNRSIYFKKQLVQKHALFYDEDEPVYGDLYMIGWYLDKMNNNIPVTTLNDLGRGIAPFASTSYTIKPSFTVTFSDGSTAETTGLVFELRIEGSGDSGYLAKMTFPLTMTKR